LGAWLVLTIEPTEGELVDLIEDFSEGRVQFAFVKVKDPNTGLPKHVLIAWVGSANCEVCTAVRLTAWAYSAEKVCPKGRRATSQAT
jgi:hypothetical protein